MADQRRPAYDRIAANYDRTRQPAGMADILRALDISGDGLADKRLLDAGCGTGSYSLALADRARIIIGIDISPGMINVARKKRDAAQIASNVEFAQGTITRLPFRSATFDGILTNQVLHHLIDTLAEPFSAHRTALQEFARVLKPDGTLVIGTSSQDQLRDGFWFYRLLSKAAARLRQRFMPLPELDNLLAQEGFHCINRLVPREALLQGDAYFDARGPFDAAWRDGDSVWAAASDEERRRCLARLRTYDANDELDARFREWDAQRQVIGQMTFICASRAGAQPSCISSGKTG